jgi:hypothetical protein
MFLLATGCRGQQFILFIITSTPEELKKAATTDHLSSDSIKEMLSRHMLFGPYLLPNEHYLQTIRGAYPSLDPNETESTRRLEQFSADARGPFRLDLVSGLLAGR